MQPQNIYSKQDDKKPGKGTSLMLMIGDVLCAFFCFSLWAFIDMVTKPASSGMAVHPGVIALFPGLPVALLGIVMVSASLLKDVHKSQPKATILVSAILLFSSIIGVIYLLVYI